MDLVCSFLGVFLMVLIGGNSIDSSSHHIHEVIKCVITVKIIERCPVITV